jgi:hypothetical protein
MRCGTATTTRTMLMSERVTRKTSTGLSSNRKPNSQRSALDTLPIVPFGRVDCRLVEPPTAEERKALEAHIRASRTREDFWQHAPRADWMLDLLRAHPERIPIVPEAQLRRFALKCVDGVQGAGGSAIPMLLRAVAGRVAGTTSLAHLEALQRQIQPAVSAGGVHGLPRCSPHAAGALAAWHAATPNPYDAAYWTAEFVARHDAFVLLRFQAQSWRSPDDRGEPWRESWRTALFARVHLHVFSDAVAQARYRQAVLLRSILPHPFAHRRPPAPAQVS